MGDVVITRDGTTITFNEKINNLDDVSGSVYFEVQGRNVTGTAEEVGNKKGGHCYTQTGNRNKQCILL